MSDNQGSFLQRPGKTVYRHLRDAAARRATSTMAVSLWCWPMARWVNRDTAGGFWSGGFESMVMMLGDTMIVPEQLNPGASFRRVKDIARILFDFDLASSSQRAESNECDLCATILRFTMTATLQGVM
jgi:hypothetical protein